MTTVSSRYFEEVGYRGMFIWQGAMRFTLKHFPAEVDKELAAQEEAELYAWQVLLRWKTIFTPTPALPLKGDAHADKG